MDTALRDERLTINPAAKDAPRVKKQVHFIWQDKGGVGKTWLAMLLAQYFAEIGEDVKCIDIDAMCPALSRFASLKAQHVSAFNAEKNRWDMSAYDILVERLLTESGAFVIDGNLQPLMEYLIDGMKGVDVMGHLAEAGMDVVVHGVVVGGSGLIDTLASSAKIAAYTRASCVDKLILWRNEYFGPVVRGGVDITDLPDYQAFGQQVKAMPVLRKPSDAELQDINRLGMDGITLLEAFCSPAFSLESKQRLKRVSHRVFGQLADIKF